MTARIVRATATTGPALAEISAARGLSPSLTNAGLRPLRTQNRNRVAGMPIANVGRLIASIAEASPPSICGQVSPPAETPRICFTWLVAIRIPMEVIKPLISGWDSRLARKDRKSVVAGKRVAGRVDKGGCGTVQTHR